MKKFKFYIPFIIFICVFIVLCSSFVVFAKSETFSFSVFDKNIMRFVTQKQDGSFFNIDTVGGNTITRLTNSTRFTNGAEFYTTKEDDKIACLWVFTDPTALDSPLYSLVGYKGCTFNFSVTYNVTPRCYSATGGYVDGGCTFKFLKKDAFIAKYFAFYDRPDWNVSLDCRAGVKSVDYLLSNSDRSASVIVNYFFTVPDDVFNIYGFTSSVGQPNTSGSLGLDEKWKTGVERAYYGFSATFSDFTVDTLDSFVAPDVSGGEVSADFDEVDDITADLNYQLTDVLSSIRGQWANIWDADFMAGFYVIKEFLDYLFNAKPWNYLVTFSLVLGCTCVALRIAPGIISKVRSKKGDD